MTISEWLNTRCLLHDRWNDAHHVLDAVHGAVHGRHDETIKAIVVASHYANSPVATAAYTIASVLPAPTFSLAAGNYATAQTLTITDAVPGTTIYYTTNDASPTTSSTKYTGPITISSSEAVAAFAAAPGYHNSATTSGVYLINNVLPTPLILPAGGTYNTSQT